MRACVGISCFLLLAGFAAAEAPTEAESYPSRPVKLIYGFASGSTGDIRARARGRQALEGKDK